MSQPIDDLPEQNDNDTETAVSETPFRYIHSANFPELFESLRISLLVTTYQAGKLIAFRVQDGNLNMLLRTFDKAMGLAADPSRLAVGTKHQVWIMRNSTELAAKMKGCDACFLPRLSYVTGELDLHELAWGESDLWMVNTVFSCLCTLHAEYSFVPRWRPPFISQLAREDHCHLNGLAMRNGKPAYVTAFGETDTREGWRPGKATDGVLIAVSSGDIVSRGLSMPHSPRVADGRLWVLDSGRGLLLYVDEESGRTEAVTELPGYTRGLAFFNEFAFVGCSKIRETSVFGGVPIAERRQERKCGIAVVDLRRGQTVAFIEFIGEIEEIFDVQVLPGIRFPQIVGLQKDTIQRACLIGPEVDLNAII